LTDKQYEEIIIELAKKREDLFTDSIRNSKMYDFLSKNPSSNTKLNDLLSKFDSDIRNAPLQKKETSRILHISHMRILLRKITTEVKRIHWD